MAVTVEQLWKPVTLILAICAVAFVVFEWREAIADNRTDIAEQDEEHEEDIQTISAQIRQTNEDLGALIELEKSKQQRIQNRHELRVEDCNAGVYTKKECRQKWGIRVED